MLGVAALLVLSLGRYRRPAAHGAAGEVAVSLERAAQGGAAQGRAGTAGGVNGTGAISIRIPSIPRFPTMSAARKPAAAQPAPHPSRAARPPKERFADRRRAHAQPHGHPAARHRADLTMPLDQISMVQLARTSASRPA